MNLPRRGGGGRAEALLWLLLTLQELAPFIRRWRERHQPVPDNPEWWRWYWCQEEIRQELRQDPSKTFISAPMPPPFLPPPPEPPPRPPGPPYSGGPVNAPPVIHFPPRLVEPPAPLGYQSW
jgi:hypothetical protein